MKFSKRDLKEISNCVYKSCDNCTAEKSCNRMYVKAELAQTALHLLNRLETAETILRDILSSGNVTACRKEIEAWLGRVEG